MGPRIDPRIILIGCAIWSVIVWIVVGVPAALYAIFGSGEDQFVAITAILVGVLFIGAGAMTLGGDPGRDYGTSMVLGRWVPSKRPDDEMSPGGLTFFGYALVAGIQPVIWGFSLLE